MNRLMTCLMMTLLALPTVATASGEHEGGHDHAGDGHDAPFGGPADPANAERTVEVTARDTMAFEPEQIPVAAGETVLFVVRNAGEVQHSFTLGTPAGQEAHEAEMQGMAMSEMAGHMADDPTGMVIPPGGVGRLAWRFEGSGPVEFACHIPGHYPAGMKGRIAIE